MACRRDARARCRLRRRAAGRGVRRPARDDGRRCRLPVGPRPAGLADRAALCRRSFARALCLDVLEHLSFDDQARALGELRGSCAWRGAAGLGAEPGAPAVAGAVPAARAAHSHGQSRSSTPATGPSPSTWRLPTRGFSLVTASGHLPDVPVVTRLIRRHPARLEPLHRLLTAVLPVPGWCFLNLLLFRRRDQRVTAVRVPATEGTRPRPGGVRRW